MNRYLTAPVRRWIYGISVTALPLLVAYGIISETTAPLWAALAGSIFVPGLAFANTPTGRTE